MDFRSDCPDFARGMGPQLRQGFSSLTPSAPSRSVLRSPMPVRAMATVLPHPPPLKDSIGNGTTNNINCDTPTRRPIRVFTDEFMLRYQQVEPKREVRDIFAPRHPCLRAFKGCRFGDRCFFRDLPQEWCVLCLLGEEHERCKGTRPDMHPCLRVWGSCKYGDKCVFKAYPRVWCLFCLRKANHTKCSGIKPKCMPAVPTDVTEQCAEHERRGTEGDDTSAASEGSNGNGNGNGNGHPFRNRTPSPGPGHALPAGFEVLRFEAQEVAAAHGNGNGSPLVEELPNRTATPFGSNRSLLAQIPEEQKIARKARGILNKITPEKYEVLMEQLMDLLREVLQKEDVDLAKTLDAVAAEVFEKAVTEQNNSKLYSKVTTELERRLVSELGRDPESLGTKSAKTYRASLLRRCHDQFYSPGPGEDNAEDEDEEALRMPKPSDELSELEIAKEKWRMRSRANTRFVGELYIRGAVPERIIDEIVRNLLRENAPRPLGPRIELLISLLEACGEAMERRAERAPQRKELMGSWFAQLQECKKSVNTRISFLIDGLFELQRRGWQAANGEERPMTLAEVEEQFNNRKRAGRALTPPPAFGERLKVASPSPPPPDKSRAASPPVKVGGTIPNPWTSARCTAVFAPRGGICGDAAAAAR